MKDPPAKMAAASVEIGHLGPGMNLVSRLGGVEEPASIAADLAGASSWPGIGPRVQWLTGDRFGDRRICEAVI